MILEDMKHATIATLLPLRLHENPLATFQVYQDLQKTDSDLPYHRRPIFTPTRQIPPIMTPRDIPNFIFVLHQHVRCERGESRPTAFVVLV